MTAKKVVRSEDLDQILIRFPSTNNSINFLKKQNTEDL